MLPMLSRKRLRRLIDGETLIWVAPETSVIRAAALMRQHHIGALAILNGSGRLMGILSERDIVHRCVGMGTNTEQTPVSEIMTSRVITADMNTTLGDAIGTMMQHDIRHLPVMQGQHVMGMVSIRRLVREYRDGVQRMANLSVVKRPMPELLLRAVGA